MVRIFIIIIALLPTILIHGRHKVYDENIRTLRVTLNDNPLLPPVLKLGHSSYLRISWDEMSHDYQRYAYRIQHCNRDWEPTTDLFESDYLNGINGLPVEDYETSFNTSQIYTHYSLTFPNHDVSVLLSGNYKLLVYDEESDEEEPVIEVRFTVVEQAMNLSMQISSNTDIDVNDSHQQVTLNLNYGSIKVTDPYSQIHAVVTQNRSGLHTVAGVRPNVNKANGLEWKHCRELIFPAGNEYTNFEILDMHLSGMNVDNMRWYDPYYHATLWTNTVPHSYSTVEDRNGAFYPRTKNQESNNTEAEYVIVHFSLESPRLSKDVYVNGEWSNGDIDPECKMHYREDMGCYEASILLKQGYYDFRYITQDGSTAETWGNFWQTENEYQTFIYYREQGGRYDRIVGYTCVNTNF